MLSIFLKGCVDDKSLETTDLYKSNLAYNGILLFGHKFSRIDSRNPKGFILLKHETLAVK